MPRAQRLAIEPVTPERWDDFRALFERSGSWPRSCWCMYWRGGLNNAQKNREAIEHVVASGARPGLLGYRDGEPVGWCAIAPRAEFGKIERSRAFNKADGDGVWSLNCFVIHPKHRRTGVATALLRAAVAFARDNGARAVEAYPAARDEPTTNDYTGTVAMFERAGFRTIAEGSNVRVIMRRDLRPRRS